MGRLSASGFWPAPAPALAGAAPGPADGAAAWQADSARAADPSPISRNSPRRVRSLCIIAGQCTPVTQPLTQPGIARAIERKLHLLSRCARVDQRVGELQRLASVGAVGNQRFILFYGIDEVGINGAVLAGTGVMFDLDFYGMQRHPGEWFGRVRQEVAQIRVALPQRELAAFEQQDATCAGDLQALQIGRASCRA